MSESSALKRRLGFCAVAAIVAGDMFGSGIFFAPGGLAVVAQANWQIYFFWALAGVIVLCGALTLAELTTLLPKPGATYYIIREGFGPFWAFLKIWVEMFVSGPGSVAGISILFGEFLTIFVPVPPVFLGAAGIILFTIINLLGVRWGGRTQIIITCVKVVALLILVGGSILLTEPAKLNTALVLESHLTLQSFFLLIGAGVAAVLFTYDGWTDVTHVAGEVTNPQKNMPRSLFLGVGTVILLYLLVNFALLRVVTLETMKVAPNRATSMLAGATFGTKGADYLQALIAFSILGAMGGLIMTLPRLYYGAALEYARQSSLFRILSHVSKTDVPSVSIIFCAVISILALFFFGSFSRIVNFFVVPFQFINILMVASIFRLRKRQNVDPSQYRVPLYPIVPLVFIVVMSCSILSAIIYQPIDTLIGVGLTASGIPFYFALKRKKETL